MGDLFEFEVSLHKEHKVINHTLRNNKEHQFYPGGLHPRHLIYFQKPRQPLLTLTYIAKWGHNHLIICMASGLQCTVVLGVSAGPVGILTALLV